MIPIVKNICCGVDRSAQLGYNSTIACEAVC